MERAIVVFLLSAASFAADRTYPTRDLSPRNMPPLLENGYLIVRADEFDIYGPEGTLAYSIGRLSNSIIPINAAIDREGRAAVALQMNSNGGAIVLYNRDGGKLATVDTGNFVPAYLAFGADQSLWAAAKGQLRHFSPEGKPLGVYGGYSADEHWQEPVVQLPALRVSGDRVGYLMHHDPKVVEWTEFDLRGKELGRWTVPPELMRSTPIFAGGTTFLRTPNGVMALDREAGQWKPTSIYAEGSLAGTDANSLVFSERHGNTLHWVDLSGR